MKNIAIVGYSRDTSYSCREQLATLLGEKVNIVDYNSETGIPSKIKADFVLFTSSIAYKFGKNCVDSSVPYMIVKRSINYHEVGKLFNIKAGTDVLLVNDVQASANETIALLQRLGIDHINYYPYSPDNKIDYPIKIAVTPGEARFVPDYIEQVIDIKTRLIDITSVIAMLDKLNLLASYADFLSANYVRDIIELSKRNFYYQNEANELKEEVNKLTALVKQKRQADCTEARYKFSDMLGSSDELMAVKKRAEKFAASNSTILIQAESGTGKEMLAQSIHNASSRAAGPFIAVNFAAITETLLDSELFGYVGGAFTGAAKQGAVGFFEQADKGTIFLDEIGDAPLSFQLKLLRVLQEKEIRRVGSAVPIKIDVRIIAATNQDLPKLISEGKFRADLYYRLNVLPLNLPPLRKRRVDILPLAYRFIQEFSQHKISDAKGYFANVAPVLKNYSWRGNIRELQNTAEYLVNVCPENIPTVADLPDYFRETAEFNDTIPPAEILSFDSEKKLILKRLKFYSECQRSCGRLKLANDLNIPESRIRIILAALAAEGKIKIARGRGGIKLIDK